MVAGTRSALTTVASTMTARPMVRPSDFMRTVSASPKEKKTLAIMRAAPVTRRPVFCEAEGNGGGVVSRLLVLLLDAAEEQDLVVHGEAEHYAEDDHQQRRVGVHGAEAEQASEVPFLEDPHEGSEGGAYREQVGQDGLERQDHRAQQQTEHHVGGEHDEPCGIAPPALPWRVCRFVRQARCPFLGMPVGRLRKDGAPRFVRRHRTVITFSRTTSGMTAVTAWMGFRVPTYTERSPWWIPDCAGMTIGGGNDGEVPYQTISSRSITPHAPAPQIRAHDNAAMRGSSGRSKKSSR